MGEFLQKNAVSIAIGLASLISAYAVNTALFGYKLQVMEAKAEQNQPTIDSVKSVTTQVQSISDRVDRQGTTIGEIRDNTVALQISQATLQTDISYIKKSLDSLLPH